MQSGCKDIWMRIFKLVTINQFLWVDFDQTISIVRRLYWFIVCTGPTFVLSDVCTSPTFVLVRCLYCPTFVSLRFVPSVVCTGTGTYVGLGQTLDQYERRASTNVGWAHLQGKTPDFGEFEKKTIAIKNKLKSLTYCDKNKRKLSKVSFI